jgi:hypothetical protein
VCSADADIAIVPETETAPGAAVRSCISTRQFADGIAVGVADGVANPLNGVEVGFAANTEKATHVDKLIIAAIRVIFIYLINLVLI